MIKFLKIIFIVAIFALAYNYRFELNQKFAPYIRKIQESLHLVSSLNPCVEPIPYNLGNFDLKFGISKTYFLSALADAEAIWEKPNGEYVGKNLFNYAPENTGKDVLKVNLVYDYRQQATSKLESLGIKVNDTKSSYESLKSKLDNIKIQYDQEKRIFNARVEAFNKKQQAYEKDVNYWNSRGGAPENEFNRLQKTQISLTAESKQIETEQNKLNSKVEEINALVVVVNRLINTLNLSVDKYNSINDSRGESFEEGVYITDGLNSQIDIYEFSNRAKLVRVLAHELGHSLGLEHIEDKDAIMYKLNQGTNSILSPSDLRALEMLCEIK